MRSPSGVFDSNEQSSFLERLASLPDVIDRRYRITGKLGSGSMGVVMGADDLFLKRQVALKFVEPDPDSIERFSKEARALAEVRHENVVKVYEMGPLQLDSAHTSYYLAMELVTGESLDIIIDRLALTNETLPIARSMKILRAVAEGLEAVHAKGLVHRDVKPPNIILERDTDRPVLIDFGLARRPTDTRANISVTGGTPSYMAPEQATDGTGQRVSGRADQYALACTAFELLTSKMVFEGEDLYTLLLAHIEEPPPKISSHRRDLAPIDDVLLRALSKQPEDRYPNIIDMVVALERGIARVGSTAAPPPSMDVASALVFANDPSLRKSLIRTLAQNLKKRGLSLPCTETSNAEEATQFVRTGLCRLLVVDEESAHSGHLDELIQLMKLHPKGELVIVSRDMATSISRRDSLHPIDSSGSGGASNRRPSVIPKPINAGIFGSVLDRLSLDDE